MVSQFSYLHPVAFYETDMAGLVHFSNFFRWMESAEHAFLHEIGFPPVKQEGETFWGWPRVRASCDYRDPVRYGDEVECRIFVKEIKLRSVVYFFRFYKTGLDGELVQVAKGEMTSVYAKFDVRNQAMAALSLEEGLLGKIEEASAVAMKRLDANKV